MARIAGGKGADGWAPKLLLLMTKPEQGTLPTVHAASAAAVRARGLEFAAGLGGQPGDRLRGHAARPVLGPLGGARGGGGNADECWQRGRVEGVERALVLDFLVGSELLYGPTGVGGTALDGTPAGCVVERGDGVGPLPGDAGDAGWGVGRARSVRGRAGLAVWGVEDGNLGVFAGNGTGVPGAGCGGGGGCGGGAAVDGICASEACPRRRPLRCCRCWLGWRRNSRARRPGLECARRCLRRALSAPVGGLEASDQ